MNTITRATISIPSHLYQAVEQRAKQSTQHKSISAWISHAIEKLLLEEYVEKNPIEQFKNIRKELPKTNVRTILGAIRKGRI